MGTSDKWVRTQEGPLPLKGNKANHYSVHSVILNPISTSQKEGEGWTPVIDFVPPGVDFTVIANSAAGNLSQSAHVELFVGYDRDAPVPVADDTLYRYRSYITPFIRVTSEIDQATKVLVRDVSAQGQFPYYWLKLVGDLMAAGTGNADIVIKVIVGRGAVEVI